MKTAIFFTTVAAILVPETLLGESDMEREFEQIKNDRSKAVAAALEPINRRFDTSLEQLLRRATQNGDLDLALRVKQALSASAKANTPAGVNSTPATPATYAMAEFVGVWIIKTADNHWSRTRTLKADGTFTADNKPEQTAGVWTVENGTLTLKSTLKSGNWEKFDLPMKGGKLHGVGQTGVQFTLSKN